MSIARAILLVIVLLLPSQTLLKMATNCGQFLPTELQIMITA